MAKVKKRKLSKSELAEVRKRTEGKSDKERTEKAIGKKATKKEVDEIMKVIDGSKKEKSKSKKTAKTVKKDKSKSKAVSTKEIKKAVKELDMPAILNSRHVTILVEEMTGYQLGIDNTAGSKNLRRYLRQLRQGLLKEQGMTSYSWSIKDDDDLSELAEIISHYQNKVAKQA